MARRQVSELAETGAYRRAAAASQLSLSSLPSTTPLVLLFIAIATRRSALRRISQQYKALIMPPPIKVPCPGCANLFSARRGLFSHLRQTTNPNCKQALQDLQAELRHQPLNHVHEPADMEYPSHETARLPTALSGRESITYLGK